MVIQVYIVKIFSSVSPFSDVAFEQNERDLTFESLLTPTSNSALDVQDGKSASMEKHAKEEKSNVHDSTFLQITSKTILSSKVSAIPRPQGKTLYLLNQADAKIKLVLHLRESSLDAPLPESSLKRLSRNTKVLLLLQREREISLYLSFFFLKRYTHT